MTSEATQLNHGDYVRLSGWTGVKCAMVGSVEGYARGNGTDEAAAYAKAIRLGHETAFSVYTGAILNAERAYHDQATVRAQCARVLEAGETVQIEGRFYKAVAAFGNERNPVNSDPIKFIQL